MNILFTSLGYIDDLRHRSTVREWQERHHIVEAMPAERLLSYLRLTSASLAHIDVIVCNADTEPDGMPKLYTLDKAVRIANEVADLPEFIAQRDGRKWKMIPFFIIGERAFHCEQVSDLKSRHASIIPPNLPTDTLLQRIQGQVDTYYDRLLQEYDNCGMMVRIVKGRSQISPALQRKKKFEESEYYYVAADRRKLARNKWLTVIRDNEGIRADVAMLEQLLNMNANEQEMQRFFEEHPAILMQARLGIPVSHPSYASPKRDVLDFALTPILGAQDGDPVDLLELKGPDAPLLNNRRLHQGLSMALHGAIDQVRNYGRRLSDPLNAVRLIRKLGYLPSAPKLAVLIGRERKDDAENELFKLQVREQVNVSVITYDEILEGQANQVGRIILPGDDDFTLPF
jgi:hypothetical protein